MVNQTVSGTERLPALFDANYFRSKRLLSLKSNMGAIGSSSIGKASQLPSNKLK
ncbi:MAG: hypothetical protein QNJ26_21205 [Desulfobacterales bacterium]|nr:hypothetical protein [Desulfobacterales bacterium]